MSLCVYCQRRSADSRDHVPPKGFLPENARTQLITVPACQLCNQSHSLDEEYFRLVAATILGGESADDVFGGAVIRSMLRRPHLEDLAWNALDIHEGIPFASIDEVRLGRVVQKIVRGLVCIHARKPLPEKHEIRLEFLDYEDWPLSTVQQFQAGHANEVHAPHFSYRYVLQPSRGIDSAWLLRFYESFSALATVSHRAA